jgi:hypothetical protein
MPAKKTPSAPRRAQRASPPARTQERRHDGHDPVVGRPVPGLATDFIGWLVTSLSVRLSRSASSYYMQRWDIGTTEYRLLLALGVEHECSAAFVAAAMHLRIDADAGLAPHIQRANALGPICFVRRQAHEVNRQSLQIDINLSSCLCGIHMKNDTFGASHGPNGSNILNHANFVVHKHDTDQNSVFANGRL